MQSLKGTASHEATHRHPRASARDRDRSLLRRCIAERGTHRRVDAEPGTHHRDIPKRGAFGFGSRHGKDIVQTATEAGSFSTLPTAVEAAGLVETLRRRSLHRVRADR